MQGDAFPTCKVHRDPGAKPPRYSGAWDVNLEPGAEAVPVKASDGDANGQDTGLETGLLCILASQIRTSGRWVAASHGAGAAHRINN